MGICAGAYLGCDWGWELLDVSIRDIEHWNRGKSEKCHLGLTPAGEALLGGTPCSSQGQTAPTSPEITVRYANGPVLEINDPAVVPIHVYRSEFNRGGQIPSTMKDTEPEP